MPVPVGASGGTASLSEHHVTHSARTLINVQHDADLDSCEKQVVLIY